MALMYRTLFRNTLLNGAAFGIMAVLGLIIAPVIIRTWGLEAFGVIASARAFLPGGMVSVFDPAMSETASLVVARSRHNDAWKMIGQSIALLLMVALCLGLCLGVALFPAARIAAITLNVPADAVDGFIPVVRLSAVVLVLAFPAIVADGVIRGMERYELLRLNEIVFQGSYVMAIVIMATSNAHFTLVAYTYAWIVAGRSTVTLAVAAWLLRPVPWKRALPKKSVRLLVLRQSYLLAQSKLFGGTLPLLISPLLSSLAGPSALAVYDIIMRIPRLVKTLVGIIPSALMPVAARLQRRHAKSELNMVGRIGLYVVPAATLPIIAAFVGNSEGLLLFWIGDQIASYWPWLSIAFVPLLLGQISNIPSVLMLANSGALTRNNRITIVYSTIWLMFGFAMVWALGGVAFILSAAIAAIVTLPWRVALIMDFLDLNRRTVVIRLLVLLVVVALGALLGRCILSIIGPEKVIALAFSLLVTSLASAGCLYFMFLTPSERVLLRKIKASAM